MLHDKNSRAKVVAYLSHLGYTQQAIADHLNVAVITVTRSLDLARKLGYLGPARPELRLRGRDLDAICPTVTDPDLTRMVQKRLRPLGVARVRVIPASERPEENARRVEVACAVLLRLAISQFEGKPHVLGLTWGMMLRGMIDAAHLPSIDPDSLTLVPISGEISMLPTDPRLPRARRSASNQLVRELSHRLGLAKTRTYFLRAPAAIPRAFQERPEALAVAWEMIEQDPTVQTILGCRHSTLPGAAKPLLARIGTVFTGIGALAPYSASTELGAFDLHDGELDQLRADGIVGDLNGHLLRAGGAGINTQSPAGRINQLAVGAAPDDLRRIAERRRKLPHHPGYGVVLGAAGAPKAPAVLAACAARAVNQLVISADTAAAILAAPALESAA